MKQIHLAIGLTVLLLLSGGKSSAQGASAAFTTTKDCVPHFYPLWFTYNQFLVNNGANHNHLVGPDNISPIYQSVVAVNDDTLYASTFLDLRAQPVILTVSATTANLFPANSRFIRDIFTSGIPALTPGTFALVGPGFLGTASRRCHSDQSPLNISVMIFRVDKFSAAGVDQTTEASTFRASIKMQTLCDYENTSCPGGVAHARVIDVGAQAEGAALHIGYPDHLRGSAKIEH